MVMEIITDVFDSHTPKPFIRKYEPSKRKLDRNQVKIPPSETFLTNACFINNACAQRSYHTVIFMHVYAFHIPFYIHALSMLMHAHARNKKKLKIVQHRKCHLNSKKEG